MRRLRNAAAVLLEPTWPSRLISELEPLADGVDGADADAVETGRDLVARVVELAAGVQHGHHDLGRAHSPWSCMMPTGMPRPLSSTVTEPSKWMVTSISVQCPAEVLVDGVVDGLPDQVVQTRAVVHVADVHAGALAHGLEPLENGDVLAPYVDCGACDWDEGEVASVIGCLGTDLRSTSRGHGQRRCREAQALRGQFLEFVSRGTPLCLAMGAKGVSLAPREREQKLAFFACFARFSAPRNHTANRCFPGHALERLSGLGRGSAGAKRQGRRNFAHDSALEAVNHAARRRRQPARVDERGRGRGQEDLPGLSRRNSKSSAVRATIELARNVVEQEHRMDAARLARCRRAPPS